MDFLVSESYDPNRLIDELIARLSLRNDASLARELGVPREIISKIRHRKRPIGPAMLITMHDISGLSIADLRTIMGVSPKMLQGK
jgi:plasmid maintenance system antidote protein VapI